jgi:hypothetical protein|tara:strand:- start:837 stop:965 length:129 start_codon:yes stop_codon:yes gene_type:complete
MNKCNNCGYDNPKDNFICEGEDCGIPMNLNIEFDEYGLPNIN